MRLLRGYFDFLITARRCSVHGNDNVCHVEIAVFEFLRAASARFCDRVAINQASRQSSRRSIVEQHQH